MNRARVEGKNNFSEWKFIFKLKGRANDDEKSKNIFNIQVDASSGPKPLLLPGLKQNLSN
jgi:hypothetical protein